jgi:hypothetical protein
VTVIVIDDGVSALTYDADDGSVVIRDHTRDVTRTYEVTGRVHRVSRYVCSLDGLEEHLSLRKMCLLAHLLMDLGYAIAYRRDGHDQHRPWGELVTYGYWSGFVHIDLSKIPRSKGLQ